MGVFNPLLVVAALFGISSYFQDVVEIIKLSFGAVIGHDTGCDLCHRTTALLLKVSELDQAGDIDCAKICFGQRQCSNICTKIIGAMATSETYPCIAAGLCPETADDSDIQCRFDWHRLGCVPASACQRKFPARCVVNAGIRSWRRYSNVVGRHAGLVASALANQPRCGEPGASEYCVAPAASQLSVACEMLTWALPFAFGTVASIRAVETPGGDDDRQWLTFCVSGAP